MPHIKPAKKLLDNLDWTSAKISDRITGQNGSTLYTGTVSEKVVIAALLRNITIAVEQIATLLEVEL